MENIFATLVKSWIKDPYIRFVPDKNLDDNPSKCLGAAAQVSHPLLYGMIKAARLRIRQPSVVDSLGPPWFAGTRNVILLADLFDSCFLHQKCI